MQHAIAEVAEREPMGRPRLPHGEEHADPRGPSPGIPVAPPGFPIYLGYPRVPYDLTRPTVTSFGHEQLNHGYSNPTPSPPLRVTPSPQQRMTPEHIIPTALPLASTPEIQTAASTHTPNLTSPISVNDSAISASSPPLTTSSSTSFLSPSSSSSLSSPTTSTTPKDKRAKPSFSISEHAAFQPEPRPPQDDREFPPTETEKAEGEAEKNRCLIISHVDTNSNTINS
ncbi:hypothetical protein ElyMa_003699200 [Elysia marginata]|uniref:Uncharacterized protein n=1 Tax=Elysia marginata TaxID=1093978 RepID=A0AAV4F2Z6_9GAST|nr:hypothetical protein ElyMa_003699200 [Elysia marginata]